MSNSDDQSTNEEVAPNDGAHETAAAAAENAPPPTQTDKNSSNNNSLKGRQSEANSDKSTQTSASTGSHMNAKPSKSGSGANMENTWNARIGFIGAGRLTESIARGLLSSARIGPRQLFVSAKSARNLDAFKVQGIATSTRPYDVFGRFDVDLVFIAVHGNVVRRCFQGGGTRPLALTTNYIPSRRRRRLAVLSLVGGIPLADLKATLVNPENSDSSPSGKNSRLEMHRAMLNASVAYGLGLGALDVEIDSKRCSPLIRDTLQLMAQVELVAGDQQLDAWCALAGHGLTTVYYLISALVEGAAKVGLPRPAATKLATKMVQGAALAILQTGKSPGQLRDESTSASGPAVYGLALLDKRDVASGIQAAVEAAYRRVKELAE
ncbi:hypothetical protein TYRP_002685 [Tyrophagus putrescentiae]|nr:hypothetical protein TYRP_002685 [Tyrophagus putrescentiae]